MLARFSRDNSGAATMIASVVSVDTDKCTCVLNDEVDYYDVRLAATEGANKGFLTVPAVGSKVMAVKIEDSDGWVVVAFTEIEKIQMKVKDESLATLAADLITAIRSMKFTTNAGPTIALVNDLDFINIQNRLNKIIY
ncbi:MAG: hypothetical protein LBD53_01070 [Tannerella sp.]|nr:hypothetical protein [Tannerella sp.]